MKMILWKYWIVLLAGLILWCCLPSSPFDEDYSTVLYDRNGQLLGAKVSSDGQWRFPSIDSLPSRYSLPLIAFEDKRFFDHRGVDPFAIGRAIIQNIKEGRIVSGASTISMQVIRLSRKGRPRTLFQKIYEAILAVRLELYHTKKEILHLYASHAPFGGNVVGIEAASWRYFNKPSSKLTWSEGTTLAVLPNAPSLIHPAKSRSKLKAKRDRLLLTLKERNVIDSLEYELSLLEPIPEKPHLLPRKTPHLLEHFTHFDQAPITYIDSEIQNEVLNQLNLHYTINKQKEIYNAAVLIVDNTSGRIISYVGNTVGHDKENAVDMVRASRSSGSILKPLLYGLMMQSGKMNPHEMLADVPTSIDGFNPKNYNKQYNGAVKAADALAMSLNVPAVRMLQRYGVEAFRVKAINLGLQSLTFSADHYGLSLILGGGEVSLYDLVNVYSRMAQKLNYYKQEKLPVNIHTHGQAVINDISDMDPGVIFTTFEAMRKLLRPDSEGSWKYFSSSRPLAWKTGTSYGHRDAWAIGVTPQFTLGVWVGNSDGEGRPEIIGSSAAGTLLFDVLNLLPNKRDWFDIPHDDLIEVPTCSTSGFIAGSNCISVDTLLSPNSTLWASSCPFHKTIFLDDHGNRANINCVPKINKQSWFVLPPNMAYYYRNNHPDYMDLPHYNTQCKDKARENNIAILYPSSHQAMYFPEGLNGENMSSVFKASHKDPDSKIYWHLDDKYLGSTKEIHEMKINVSAGHHKIFLLDSEGNSVNRTFEVVGD